MYLNFIIVYNEDEIKGMLEELKSEKFFRASSKGFQVER